MLAYRADFRSFRGFMDMPAVPAFLLNLVTLFENSALLNRVKQTLVAILMRLVDLGYTFKDYGDDLKSLFACLLRHSWIHLCPLTVFPALKKCTTPSLLAVQQMMGDR